jgi:hypothetical protein
MNKSLTEQEEIDKKIKNGWIAAVISMVMTIALMLLAATTGMLQNLFNIWSTFDVVLGLALAFGIYKKSRFAATTMFIYFLLSKIFIFSATGKPTGVVTAIIFLYFYFQAMVATYQHHKLAKSVASSLDVTQ